MDGRFQKGEHRSPTTEFKPGSHWRPKKPYWEKAWLEAEYVEKQRSVSDIAHEWGIGVTAISYWLAKHGIPQRPISEVRQLKYWGLTGQKNGMFGKHGPEHPNWKGGVTPERQALQKAPGWKTVCKQVRQRDRGLCQRCLKRLSKARGYAFHVHHRITFEIRELRLNVDNLVLLCPTCHHWVHSKANIHRLFLGSFQASLKGVSNESNLARRDGDVLSGGC